MKLGWNVLNGGDEFALFMKRKFFSKKGIKIRFHKPSSIWKGIENALKEINPNSSWIIGNGETIDLWRDEWLNGRSIQQIFGLSEFQLENYTTKLSLIIQDGQWNMTSRFKDMLAAKGVNVLLLPSPNSEVEDARIWNPDPRGKFTIKSAFNEIRKKTRNKIGWSRLVLNKAVHPRVANNGWKLVQNCAATQEMVRTKGIHLASRCVVCQNVTEDLNHLLWSCPFTKQLWLWVASKFKTKSNFQSFHEAIYKVKQGSTKVKNMWSAAVLSGMKQVMHAAKTKAHMWDCTLDKAIMWGVTTHFGRAPCVKECEWFPPQGNIIKAWGWQLTTNYIAECEAIVCALELAISKGWLEVWVESDARAAVMAFVKDQVSWNVSARWTSCKRKFTYLLVSHTWRESNFAADTAAKRGTMLERDVSVIYDGRPPWLFNLEDNNHNTYCSIYKSIVSSGFSPSEIDVDLPQTFKSSSLTKPSILRFNS
ncbi:hypothetical protein IFM89_034522 [Coptis chinensis]|uniref:Uncharacterized protein n=1 Tax=Coptis chinensis TaxID=261450 RepID=A0A835LTW4_9MAGN|nr:hypothetical protein IFM89_034522 [Coptis chinensis]